MMLPFLHQPSQTKNNNATGPSSTVSYTQQCRSWPHSLLSFIRKSFKNDLHTATEQRMKIQHNNMSLPLRATVPRAQILRSNSKSPCSKHGPPTNLLTIASPTSGRCTGTRGRRAPAPRRPRHRPDTPAPVARGDLTQRLRPRARALALTSRGDHPTDPSFSASSLPRWERRPRKAEAGGAPARPCRPTRCDQRREPFPGLGSGPPA